MCALCTSSPISTQQAPKCRATTLSQASSDSAYAAALERLLLSGKTGQLSCLVSSFSSKPKYCKLQHFRKKPDNLLVEQALLPIKQRLCNQQAPVFSATTSRCKKHCQSAALLTLTLNTMTTTNTPTHLCSSARLRLRQLAIPYIDSWTLELIQITHILSLAAGDANILQYADAYAWIQTFVPSCAWSVHTCIEAPEFYVLDHMQVCLYFCL